MKSGIFLIAALLVALTTQADAHHYRHHQDHQNPVARGLGLGLIHMLRASRNQDMETGKPQWGWTEDREKYHRPAWSWPNLVDVPPKGWPFRKMNQTRISRFANLDSSCRSAARQGGPCGCWAQEHFFGSAARIFHGMNLWLAREWLRFPHTSPAAGTAAVWPGGRHVAPVVGVNGDGTITVADSWGTHAVRMARLTFVNPR
jgi:hypothetical protein